MPGAGTAVPAGPARLLLCCMPIVKFNFGFAPPPTFDELRPKIESDMAQEIGAKTMENLRQSSKIDRFEIDPRALDAMLQ